MKLLEIQRQMKTRRNFREGKYAITVVLEHPGDEFQEFLKVKITEDGKQIARAIFKQWSAGSKWEPLSITFTENEKKVTLREMMYNAVASAGFFIKD